MKLTVQTVNADGTMTSEQMDIPDDWDKKDNTVYPALSVPEILAVLAEKRLTDPPGYIHYDECPGCGSPDRVTSYYKDEFVLHNCQHCGAIYGVATNTAIGGILKGAYRDRVPDSAHEHGRYWDFMEPATDREHGYARTHGWFDGRNGKIFQWG